MEHRQLATEEFLKLDRIGQHLYRISCIHPEVINFSIEQISSMDDETKRKELDKFNRHFNISQTKAEKP